MVTPSIHIDKLTFERIAAGDENAFKLLFNEYWDNIYGVAFMMTKSREAAKDVVQEVFIKVWLQREELPKKESFRDFLFIITRNHILSELRKKRRAECLTDELRTYSNDNEQVADEGLLYKESAALIQEAVERLSPQQREVYLLSREKGWSQEQIAAHLGISKSTIKTHMSRALTTIRLYLEANADKHLLLFVVLEAFLWKK